jgi:hypothetical protein
MIRFRIKRRVPSLSLFHDTMENQFIMMAGCDGRQKEPESGSTSCLFYSWYEQKAALVLLSLHSLGLLSL